MDHNPYAAPGAAVDEPRRQKGPDPVALYSPSQVAGAAFLGGPIAIVYLLAANFAALDRPAALGRTLLCGVVAVPLFFAMLFFLPNAIPAFLYSLTFVVSAHLLVERLQLGKDAIRASPDHAFQSNWRVVGIAMACAFASLIAGVVIVYAARAAGIDLPASTTPEPPPQVS